MCDKKKLSLDKAKWIIFNAQAARRLGSEKRQEIRYYYCNLCNSYHVTSKYDRFKTKNADSH